MLSISIVMAFATPSFGQCDGERWNVKAGVDNDAALVNLGVSSGTTLGSLTAIAKPKTLPDNNRIQPTETTVWTLTANLVKYAKMWDGDYHIVFKDSSGKTMIGEIPDPSCISSSSPFRPGIAHARSQFDAVLTAIGTFQNANIPVTVTGVGFFDYFEGQEGYAANGIELHPIIDIQFGGTLSLGAAPSSLNVPQGSSSSTTITTSITSGFNSDVSLTTSGLPAGVSASFSPPMISAPGSGSSTLTFIAVGSAPAGTFNVTVSASGGGQTKSVPLSVTVGNGQQLFGNPGFENGAITSPWVASAGVVDGSTAMAAHTGTWKAWLDGYGTTHTDTLYQQASIPSSASSAILTFWKHIETAENKGKANDTVQIQIRSSSGANLKTLATYSNLNSAAGYSQASFDITAYKGQTVQIYLVGTENGSLKTSFVFDDFALTVAGQSTSPDFSLVASPASLSVAAGGSAQSTITTSSDSGFNSAISLAASGLPSGLSAAFSPQSIAAPGSGTSVMTLTSAPSIAAGAYNFQVSASGGSVTHTTPITVTVSSSGGVTTQLLGNPGFENGSTSPAPWSVSSGVINNNAAEAPHSGSWDAWMNGYGSVHTDTLYQQVTVPSAATNATLTFWRHIDTTEASTTTAYDTLKVQVRDPSGTVLATLATYSNLNAAVGYTQVSFDLTGYKGQTIQIYFVGVEDSSLKTSFVVDDLALNVTTP